MILTNWRRAEELIWEHYGQVGAGKVVDFIPRGKKKVVLPASRKSQDLIIVSVSGDSLHDIGINDGDDLYCRQSFDMSEIKNGKLVVAQLPCFGLVVKFFFQFEKKIALRSANPRYQDLIFDEDLVEIKAIVVHSIKNWE